MIISSFTQKLSLMALGTLSLGLGSVFIDFQPVQAADFSFRGNFSTDDEVQLFNFSVGATSTVTLKTLSYAGGTQADGTVISAGGFDPILALFDGSGNFIDGNDDGFFPNVEIDPVTGVEYDTFLQAPLDPGNYTVAISQFDNFFVGGLGDNISLGFDLEGDSTFTSTFGCSNGQFCDFTSDNRTNEWAFDVLNVETAVVVEPSANVPEPASILGLLTIGTLGVASLKRKKSS